MKRLTWLLFVIAIQSVVAQDAFLAGRVITSDSEPAAYTNIRAVGTSYGTAADSAGQFRLTLRAGDAIVEFLSIGYARKVLDVTLSPGEVRVVTVVLDRETWQTDSITVESDRVYSASSSSTVTEAAFDLRPRKSSQDLLQVVPGLVVAQHAGGGKAEQIFLRGFDADHGTDVAIAVDGVPVNMVSHGHGQGYADLHFLIPEVVETIEVQKGAYDARWGNFATAGAVQFRTRDHIDRNVLTVEAGRWNTYRSTVMLNMPTGLDRSTVYFAAEARLTDGYFERSQDFRRLNLFSKMHTHLSESTTLRVSLSGFRSQWNASGQIPERAVRQGLISRYGSVDDSEGGMTSRYGLNAQLQHVGHGIWDVQVYTLKYTFDLFSNFTFYKLNPVQGDAIEQQDRRTMVGAKSQYIVPFRFAGNVHRTTVGIDVRRDQVDVGLWRVERRDRYDVVHRSDVGEIATGIFVQHDVTLGKHWNVQAALRADRLAFSVQDSATYRYHETVFSPKANVAFNANEAWTLYLNTGFGFHSNDARSAVTTAGTGRSVPRAVTGELGVRYKPHERLVATMALWQLDLQGELVYVGDEGTTELSGRTRRFGVESSARWRMFPFLWMDADVTITRGRLRDVPEGENRIPLAPTWTAVGGLTYRPTDRWDGQVRFRSMGDRPANEQGTVTAHGYILVDAGLAMRLSNGRVGLQIENLFNRNWNEAQVDTESQLKTETQPVSELHFTPGSPRQITVFASVNF
jgi:outer membrane cobalamin receptor